MKVEKKVVFRLTKCYSIAPLHYRGQDCILVAAEKTDRCLLFDRKGELLDTIWEGPGGTMSMVQIPGSDGQFLATQKFYSPNDSADAEIVAVYPEENGGWGVRTLVKLPHVHRFDIVKRNGTNYLVACTLKSGHKYKDDWSMPGKVYAAALPDDFTAFDKEHPLELQVIRENMLKNHGYYRVTANDMDTCLISAECGVFRFFPPEKTEGEWEVEQLLDAPASDAVLADFDGDGEKELAVIAPFHGNHIRIYKKRGNGLEKVYEYEKPADFSHAIYGGELCGRQTLVVGHRGGEKSLLAFRWEETGGYRSELIDKDCGSANVFHYVHEGKDVLISANREIDEIALYTLEDISG